MVFGKAIFLLNLLLGPANATSIERKCWHEFKKSTVGEYPKVKKLIEKNLKYEDESSGKDVAPILKDKTPIYIVSEADDSTVFLFTVNDVDDVEISGGFTGSGGSRILIIEKDKKSQKILLNNNFIEVMGAIGESQHPDIYVLSHGSEFDRVGNLYGLTLLSFSNEKSEYVSTRKELKKKIKKCK